MIDHDFKLTVSELQTLRLILDAGPISRVKIAQKLKLTRAAVTLAVQQLQKRGYIIEAGKGESKAGRREVLLSGNPDAGLFFTVHFALRYTTIGLVNLTGNILYKTHLDLASDTDTAPQFIIDQVTDTIKNYILEHNISTNRLWGIGVSLPGIIDYEKGTALESTIQGWENFEIKKAFNNHFACPVIIENDVKTLTLAEFRFSTGLHVKNMICLWMEDGIGAGIIINGRLFRGHSYSAGEIGFNEFIRPPANGKSLLIRQKPRFWGDILAFSNIKSAVQMGIEEGWHTTMSRDITIDDFIEAANANDPLAMHIFRMLGQVLGVVCSNMIFTFNPEVLLLSGPLFRRLPGLADVIHKHLSQTHLRTPIKASSIRISTFGEDSITIGGALLLLEHLLKLPE